MRAPEPCSDARPRALTGMRRAVLALLTLVALLALAGPAVAFGFSFSILFREGVEAVLLIAILLGSLQAGSAANYKRPLAAGVIAALGATALTWVIATLVIDLAPVNRELLEAGTA